MARRVPTASVALVLSLSTAASAEVPKNENTRRVVFMVDQSGSMPQSRNGLSFAVEIEKARQKAEGLIRELEQYPGTSVSLWTFGEKDNQSLLGADTADMTPSGSLAKLPEFFSPDAARYKQKWTTIAYSIFQLVWRQIGVDPLTKGPADDIPADAPPLQVFVFTDGEEDPGPAFAKENPAYVAWLQRQGRNLQIRWKLWKLYGLEGENGGFDPAPPDKVLYTAHFGVPTDAYAFDPEQKLPDGGNVPLAVPAIVRLVPGRPLDPAEAATLGACVCEPDSDAFPPAPSGARTLSLEARVHWGEGVSPGTPTWKALAPQRNLSEVVTSESPLPVRQYSREVLLLQLGAGENCGPGKSDCSPRAVLNTEAILAAAATTAPRLEFPIRFDATSLCRELKRAYPNSTFVFPGEAKTAPGSDTSCLLARLGSIVVDRRPRYRFTLASPDGTQPTRPFILSSDRWHRYEPASRRFRVVTDAPATVGPAVEVSALVRRGGKPVDGAVDIVTLGGPASAVTSVTVKPGVEFDVFVPAVAQPWWGRLLGQGFARPDGAYDIELRVAPKVSTPPEGGYRLVLDAPGAEAGRFTIDARVITIHVPVTFEPRPASYWRIGSLTALALLALWLAVRWITRPRFPEVCAFQPPSRRNNLRRAHEALPRGPLWLFCRKPLYASLLPRGEVKLTQVPPIPGKERVAFCIVGLRPSPAGGRSMLVWCVRVKEPEKSQPGVRYELRLDGNGLEARNDVPRTASPGRAESVSCSTSPGSSALSLWEVAQGGGQQTKIDTWTF